MKDPIGNFLEYYDKPKWLSFIRNTNGVYIQQSIITIVKCIVGIYNK